MQTESTALPQPGQGLSEQRVLVTGGAGVIGRELLACLSAAGARVLSIDRLPIESPTPAGIEHVVADLAVADLETIERFGPRHVFHLAATFERSAESPEFWIQNWNDNVVVTHRLAELAERIRGVESFVFASSYLVYDSGAYLSSMPPREAVALSEEAKLRPRNLCGAAKLYGESEIRFIRDVHSAGYRAIFARIFRVYGRGSRDVVSRWVRAALAGEPIDVYHEENRFDYVFSGDVAEGLLRMATTPAATGVINLASGVARPVQAVIDAVEKATATRLGVRHRAIDEPYEASAADVGRLKAVLDWVPRTTLETGVERLVEFERAVGRKGESVGVDR